MPYGLLREITAMTPPFALGRLLGLPAVKNEIDLHEAVLAGLPADSLENLIDLGLDRSQVFKLVGARTTLQRRLKQHGTLDAGESDRLARVGRIIALATETFGDQRKALGWLQRSSNRLGSADGVRSRSERKPIDLIATEQGARLVEERLQQIAHGLFA